MKLVGANSIRRKLNFILGLTTTFALLMAGLGLVIFDQRSQRQSLIDDILTQADIVGLSSSSALAFDDPKVAAENLRVLQAKPNVSAAALFDAKGNLFATFQPKNRSGKDIPPLVSGTSTQIAGDWAEVWRPVRSNGDLVGTIYLQVNHDLFSRLAGYLGVLFVILTSSLAAALLLSNRLQAALLQPVLTVSNVARQILEQRDFTLRAEKTSEDEIGALADVFNAMLDELGTRAATLEKANRALRDSDDRYQLAVRGSTASLWDWDMEAGTTFYSPQFKALLGYTHVEFPDLPDSLGNVMHEEDRQTAREALDAHLAHDKPYQVECRLKLRDGSWRWFMIAGMARKDASGQAFRMAGSIIDITERKSAEQILFDANRAKDEFLATLAHELRNPLAPIRTGLEILKKDSANGPASHRARETMERQLAHMIRLIDDLLDISRINSGKIRLATSRINLSSVIETALDLSRPVIESRTHQLTVQLPERNIELMGDPTRLAQALGNLLNNAAKYTSAGGKITLHAWQEAATAVIEIKDNGVGIPTDMLDSVFSLFTQVGRTLDSSQGGLGIGLYLVRSLIELHGGQVTAASDGANNGSTFTVKLPCLLQPMEASPKSSTKADGLQAQKLKILIVDDNEDAAETLSAVLDMDGHAVQTVYSGELALEAATSFLPDVVLLDIGLPGISGYEVARQLRANPCCSLAKLVAVTGWGTEADRRRSREAGFDEHLTKPIDLAELQSLLFSRHPEASGAKS
ncbi:MAG: ATP-binding protein [Pseudomonadota bacterium]